MSSNGRAAGHRSGAIREGVLLSLDAFAGLPSGTRIIDPKRRAKPFGQRRWVALGLGIQGLRLIRQLMSMTSAKVIGMKTSGAAS